MNGFDQEDATMSGLNILEGSLILKELWRAHSCSVEQIELEKKQSIRCIRPLSA